MAASDGAKVWWCVVTVCLVTAVLLGCGQQTLYHMIASVLIGIGLSLHVAGASRVRVLLSRFDVFNLVNLAGSSRGKAGDERGTVTPRASAAASQGRRASLETTLSPSSSFTCYRDPLGSLLATPRHGLRHGHSGLERRLTAELCAEAAVKLEAVQSNEARRSLVASPPKGQFPSGDGGCRCHVSPACCVQ